MSDRDKYSLLASFTCTQSYFQSLQKSIQIKDTSIRKKLTLTLTVSSNSSSHETIKKHDFPNMLIIGQFNKGFIITQHLNNLYIIDQHASDEIYNYESYLKTFMFSTQLLIQPIRIDWSPQLRDTLVEYESVVKDVGWRFINDDNNNVMLTGVPLVKNLTFAVTGMNSFFLIEFRS